jgi:hypothetical protein
MYDDCNLAGHWGNTVGGFQFVPTYLADGAFPQGGYCHCMYGAMPGGWMYAFMHAFNALYSKIRVSVEWYFGHIKNSWRFVDYQRNHKTFRHPVGKYFVAAMLMQNCRTCIHWSQQGYCYDCPAPTLSSYLNGQPRAPDA